MKHLTSRRMSGSWPAFSVGKFVTVIHFAFAALLLNSLLVTGQDDDSTIAPYNEDVGASLSTSVPGSEIATSSPTTRAVDEVETLAPSVRQTPALATDSPTVGETTVVPTLMPTNTPVIPTLAPTVFTDSPTIITLAPTNAPTTSPSVAPVTKAPTTGPTKASTSSPVVGPTFPPSTGAPTKAAVTPAPTAETTTVPPTTTPTVSPTATTPAPTADTATPEPTGIPTSSPTGVPTGLPTAEPSSPPSAELVTSSPSSSTGGDSEAPASIPSVSPAPTDSSGTVMSGTLEDLSMTLVGMNQVMSLDAEEDWKAATELHTLRFYQTNTQMGITNVDVTIDFLDQEVVTVRRSLRQRGLNTASVKVKYNQLVSYRTNNPDRDTLETVSKAPFEAPADVNAYVESLRESNSEFQNVETVQDVGVDDNGNVPPVIDPEESDGGGLSTGAIVGIVLGCVGALLLVGGIGYYVSQRGDDGGYVTAGKTPPSQLDVAQGPDEVSTLAEPNTIRQSGVTNALSGESVQGYGDQSVATVDYDYSKAYGGGGDTSVSSAGGTFGSQTHTQAAGGSAMGSVTNSTNAGALDGPGYAEAGSQFRGQNANVREELIDIYAPPGKLGVVIDTPDDGAPVVHAVKDSSVIADKLQVGDKLVAVDDEDVRSMTAIKVSKLISRKSANPSRKLSIIRTVVIDE